MRNALSLTPLVFVLVCQGLVGPATASQPRAITQTLLAKSRTPNQPESITLTASVSSEVAGALQGKVEFEDVSGRLGRADLVEVDGKIKATLEVANLAPGMHLVYARYLGNDAYLGSISPALEVFVRSRTRGESD